MAIPLKVIANDSGHATGTVNFSPVPGAVELVLSIHENLGETVIPMYLIYGLNLKIDTLETIALVISNNGVASPEKVTISSDNDEVLLELEDEYGPGTFSIAVALRITRKDISPPPPSECRPHPHPHPHPHSHPHNHNPFI